MKINLSISRIIRLIILGFLAVIIIGGFAYDGCDHLGGGYFYQMEDQEAIFGPEIDIPPFIANYNHDKNFIVVKQVLEDSTKIPCYSMYKASSVKYPAANGTFFWIIDKKKKTYYGPMYIDEFEEKCDSLGVKVKLSRTDKFHLKHLE